MARWTAGAKWGEAPAPDGQRDMPLALSLSEWLGVDAHKLTARMRAWNLMALRFEIFNMKLDGFLNHHGYLFPSISGRDAARKVGYVGTKAAGALFDDHQVLHVRPHFFKPACFRMLLKVPGGTSTLGLPAIVTVPAFNA